MPIIEQFTNAEEFWHGMVKPDYNEYLGQKASLRLALHLANSLFHMSDWVFHSHENDVRSAYTLKGKAGQIVAVACEKDFATALEQTCDDFGRIRGIANAGKHLKLAPGGIRPVQNAPSNAANTRSQSTGFGRGRYGTGPWGGTPRVILADPNGNYLEFQSIAEKVYQMWEQELATRGWW
ncbi:hypothetical protein OSH11_17360 [Kaistia dalseonensis]|uniref:Uncharacterized protein n=1 Tax=Kaistia dalseonensis TaxID=410840 RepID=A0ABU0H9V6_9HYPH|nr:hypothetical protein [Kaistia dalseonensis]MCX5496478.1 hypothetical protein [Kaistia dalseonensis]MDQ0439100.1 hypothetical protein [Kaistia dalseonensis]